METVSGLSMFQSWCVHVSVRVCQGVNVSVMVCWCCHHGVSVFQSWCVSVSVMACQHCSDGMSVFQSWCVSVSVMVCQYCSHGVSVFQSWRVGVSVMACGCFSHGSWVFQSWRVGVSGLHYIAQHGAHLERLDVAWCSDITDQGIIEISAACPKLRYLGIMRCGLITMATVEQLLQRHPSIQYSNFELDSRRLLGRAAEEGYRAASM